MSRLLLLDIETAPNTAFVWGLFDQNISHNQVEISSYILCWSAKWLGSREPMQFFSKQHSTTKEMLAAIHLLMDEADVIIHYNGQKFDIPVLNKEFLKHRFTPPSPYKQIDLYLEVRRSFRFESNKMDAIAKALSVPGKLEHEGFSLWTGCMQNKPESWKKMGRYNKQDVKLLEVLYTRLRPWIRSPVNLCEGNLVCPRCQSRHYQSRGFARTAAGKYQRYQCKSCATWFRGTKNEAVKGRRFVAL